MITLSDQTPVAKGSERVVYLHPHDETALIKVLVPQADQTLSRGFRNITQAMFPGLRNRAITKEYQEYARIMLLHPTRQTPFPITHMRGFIQTDIGLGCVTDRVVLDDKLAPTLAMCATAETLDDRAVAALNAMTTAIYDLGVRASDLSAYNIVLGHRADTYEAVLVDGFGDIHAVPIRTWSKWLNRLAIDASFEKVALRTGLHWSKTKRQFAL